MRGAAPHLVTGPHLPLTVCICFLPCPHCRQEPKMVLGRLKGPFPNSMGRKSDRLAWIKCPHPFRSASRAERRTVWAGGLVQGSETGYVAWDHPQETLSLPGSADSVLQTAKISEKQFIVTSFQMSRLFSSCVLCHKPMIC